ncbi:P-loop NTPase fold protein [Chryseobacterium bernardetii]|uniref:KAP family P-loop NTPase fold protein n=1 Tax=Chryseobacterium bernardetii TaxID=1241978 RepID=UPI0016248558|nr:P-loop NTPase fold protein [Chryseobacterium bernardetii]
MKLLDSLFKILKKFKNILFLIVIYFCFENGIVEIYKKYIVEKVLILFSSSWMTEILFYLTTIVILLWIVNKYKKGFYFEQYTILYSIVVFSFYSYIRLVFGKEFSSLRTISYVKYFDLLYIVILSVLILSVLLKLKRLKESNNSTPFVEDVPISKAEEDILNRKGKALQVARFIKSNHTDSSIALGIVGKWGDGKTSFMSLVEESFTDNNDYIIIKFRSWLNISVQSIFSDFFSTVENEIKPYSIDIAKQIKKYGKSVLPISKSDTAEFILKSLDLVSDKSVLEEFESVDNLLVALQKKIIIFLDDLDRLQPNEVFEVLKLIRNTASFKTFNYIVGYEKSYIIKALEINKIPNPEKYCDKIFLNEFYLMPIQNYEISDYILKNLKEKMNNNSLDFDKVFERYSLYSQYNIGNIFSSIRNLRDAKRFLNEFFISVEKIQNDIDLGDFIIIKLLKYCYNEVYFLLYSNKSNFVGIDNYSGYRYPGGIRRIGLKKDSQTSSSDFNESLLRSHLLENKVYNISELEHIRVMFQILLSEVSYKSESLAFSFNHNFYKYFSDEINESEISIRDYERFINLSWEHIIEYIDIWEKEGKLFGLLAHLYHTDPRNFDSREKFENYIRLLFYLGKKNLKYFHLDFDYIDRTISNYDNRVTTKFYDKDVSLYEEFIKNLLYQGNFPYIFEMRIASYLFEKIYEEEDAVLTKEILKGFIISRCALFIDKMDYTKHDFFDLFYRTKLRENYRMDHFGDVWHTTDVVLPEIIEMLKNAIKKFPDLFLADILQDGGRRERNKNTSENQIIGLHDFILNLFSSYDEFIEFVKNDISDETCVFKNEFLDFADKLPTKDDFISYDFSYPPVKNKFLNSKNGQID